MSSTPLTYLGDRTRRSYRWEKRLSTKDWAEKNIYLNANTSPITGYLDLKYSPHLVEMFDDYDKKHMWKGIGKFSTQCGKTLYLQVIMAKKLDTKPSKLQWAIPNEKDVSDYIIDKIDPFMKGVSTLQEKIDDFTEKEKTRLKRSRIVVAGGDCIFTGTSASSKRSKTIQEMFIDEADLMKKGSIIELEGRTKSYEDFGRKVLATSSIDEEDGEISIGYDSCECKKEWHMTCKCGHHWLAGSKHLKWKTKKEFIEEKGIKEIDDDNWESYRNDAVRNVYVECPDCSARITTQMKKDSILNGEYFFHRISGDDYSTTYGYTGNALAMYLTSFEIIATLIINAEKKGDIEGIKQVYKDYFNEIYKQEETDKVSKNDILLLSNGLIGAMLPHDTAMVFMSIDTQKNHFWYEVKAFEYGVKSHFVLAGRAESFQDLEDVMTMVFECEDGTQRGINEVYIDRKGIKERTIEVDAWVEYLVVNQGMQDFIYLTEGETGGNSSLPFRISELKKDLSTGERRKTPLKVIKVNTNMIKNELQNMINRNIARVNAEDGSEEQDFDTRLFFISQSLADIELNSSTSISTDLSRQLTSEHYVYKVNQQTGKVATTKTWEKRHSSIDNHFFDTSTLSLMGAIKNNISTLVKPKALTHQEIQDLLPD